MSHPPHDFADSAPYHFNQIVNQSGNRVARMEHRGIRGIEAKKVISAKAASEMKTTATKYPEMRKL